MLVHDETQWRARPATVTLSNGRDLQVSLSRWRGSCDGPVEVRADDDDDSHVLTLVQRRVRQELLIGGRRVWAGGEDPDAMLITGPRQGGWRGMIGGRFDNLRIFLPQNLLRDCIASSGRRQQPGSICLFETAEVEDEGLRQLALAFKAADIYDGMAGPSFVEGIALAFGSRLIALHEGGMAKVHDNTSTADNAVHRAIDYIEAHLGEAIYLSQLSDVTGLPRVRLAAKFKAATGRPPYAYILDRRIRRAQDLLRQTQQPVVSVALALGFSSQAHFSAAFHKITGTSPALWRRQAS
ncbi:helix-turn-helix domain-containing protein [Bradyrhizobium sp. HKCCYLS3077]|uniref:helix-turn-helix domain-containing protein n=1 Tax=Bradyrhizobium sp. HKCCYLS3077 TaxID=3420761 RepID=UPI003EB9ECD3